MAESTSRHPAYARLLDRAVRILAMYDHSEQELRRKPTAPTTGKNGPEEIDATTEDYERAVAWYHERGYLDNSRFATRFIASRSRKSYGSARIRQELNQEGISRETTERAMRERDIDQCALARDQAIRKYSEPLPTIFSEKVKIQHFLFCHDYLMEDIQGIWRSFTD